MGTTALTQNVVGDDLWRSVEVGGSRATEVALFSAAHRLFTSGEPMPIPPPTERVATISKLSLQHADRLTSDSLLGSFLELELPQRAVLHHACSLHDIATILQRTSDETVAILSRGKTEWLTSSSVPRQAVASRRNGMRNERQKCGKRSAPHGIESY